MSHRIADLAALLGGSPHATPSQTASRRAYTFQGGVEVIRLSLSVTDEDHRLVRGLGEGDFAVYEDGARQALSYFSPEPLPLSVSLLIDCSSSMRPADKLPLAQAAGWRFVEMLRPEDEAQVVQFNDRVAVLEDFTADHRALRVALESTRASGTTGLLNALYDTLSQLRRQGRAQAPRRRAIVLLSDGDDTSSLVEEEQVLELARKADVAIYPIALRPSLRNADARGPGSFLATLARMSGGETHFPRTAQELDSIYRRIAEELRAQYTLGYVSRNDRRTGLWRQITVRTPANAKLQVRHKLGYFL